MHHSLFFSQSPSASFSSVWKIPGEIYLSRSLFFGLLHRFPVEWFSWMNLNVPGYSERLIFTMDNNDKKFIHWVLLKPDDTLWTILLEENSTWRVNTLMFKHSTTIPLSRQVNTDDGVNHRLAKACGTLNTYFLEILTSRAVWSPCFSMNVPQEVDSYWLILKSSPKHNILEFTGQICWTRVALQLQAIFHIVYMNSIP